MITSAFEHDAFRDGSHFTPAETFSAKEAPVRKVFSVYFNSERLIYDGYPDEFVKVAKTSDGQIVSFNGQAHDHWLCEFKLPENAILVSTGNFAAGWDFALLGCIGIPTPNAEQRSKLENIGVIFYDHAPFEKLGGLVHEMSVNFSFSGYTGVRLPQGWTTVEKQAWHYNCPSHIEIRDSQKCLIACIDQKNNEFTAYSSQ
jgi:hypothetical protein